MVGGPIGGLAYVWAREMGPLDSRHGDRLDNVIIATVVIGLAFYINPGIAFLALTTTAMQYRDTEGNFFDNLNEMTQSFAVSFTVALALAYAGGYVTGEEVELSIAGAGSIPVTQGGILLAFGGSTITSEFVCRNKRHVPKFFRRPLAVMGFNNDKEKEQKDPDACIK